MHECSLGELRTSAQLLHPQSQTEKHPFLVAARVCSYSEALQPYMICPQSVYACILPPVYYRKTSRISRTHVLAAPGLWEYLISLTRGLIMVTTIVYILRISHTLALS